MLMEEGPGPLPKPRGAAAQLVAHIAQLFARVAQLSARIARQLFAYTAQLAG